ncbi:TPA: Cro/CI family transcriptional regulator [Pseudomonas aeruginosa]
MKRIHLKQFVADRGQVDSASLLGVTQGAISKALRVGRDIYVTEHDDGTFTAEELRPFPSQAKTQAA